MFSLSPFANSVARLCARQIDVVHLAQARRQNTLQLHHPAVCIGDSPPAMSIASPRVFRLELIDRGTPYRTLDRDRSAMGNENDIARNSCLSLPVFPSTAAHKVEVVIKRSLRFSWMLRSEPIFFTPPLTNSASSWSTSRSPYRSPASRFAQHEHADRA